MNPVPSTVSTEKRLADAFSRRPCLSTPPTGTLDELYAYLGTDPPPCPAQNPFLDKAPKPSGEVPPPSSTDRFQKNTIDKLSTSAEKLLKSLLSYQNRLNNKDEHSRKPASRVAELRMKDTSATSEGSVAEVATQESIGSVEKASSEVAEGDAPETTEIVLDPTLPKELDGAGVEERSTMASEEEYLSETKETSAKVPSPSSGMDIDESLFPQLAADLIVAASSEVDENLLGVPEAEKRNSESFEKDIAAESEEVVTKSRDDVATELEGEVVRTSVENLLNEVTAISGNEEEVLLEGEATTESVNDVSGELEEAEKSSGNEVAVGSDKKVAKESLIDVAAASEGEVVLELGMDVEMEPESDFATESGNEGLPQTALESTDAIPTNPIAVLSTTPIDHQKIPPFSEKSDIDNIAEMALDSEGASPNAPLEKTPDVCMEMVSDADAAESAETSIIGAEVTNAVETESSESSVAHQNASEAIDTEEGGAPDDLPGEDFDVSMEIVSGADATASAENSGVDRDAVDTDGLEGSAGVGINFGSSALEVDDCPGPQLHIESDVSMELIPDTIATDLAESSEVGANVTKAVDMEHSYALASKTEESDVEDVPLTSVETSEMMDISEDASIPSVIAESTGTTNGGDENASAVAGKVKLNDELDAAVNLDDKTDRGVTKEEIPSSETVPPTPSRTETSAPLPATSHATPVTSAKKPHRITGDLSVMPQYATPSELFRDDEKIDLSAPRNSRYKGKVTPGKGDNVARRFSPYTPRLKRDAKGRSILK